MFDIREQLKKLPDSPGVYLHKDAFGQIIYVGKAISLKNRVRQYFNSPRNQPPKVRKMVEQITEFDYITTGTEMEALILECNLIKKYTPKYNVLLRDDKTYPYIKVTLRDEYPRILKTRRLINDGSKYFGPYADAGAVNQIIDLLNRAYALKRCAATQFPDGVKPCLNYHISQCRGICLGTADREEYARAIEKAMDFLQGKDRDLIRTLTAQMQQAAGAMDYETAASLRDSLEAAKAIIEKQRVVLSRKEDLDLVLIHSGESGIHGILFTVREGKLSGRESFPLGDLPPGEEMELTGAFIQQYYDANVLIPREILVEKLPCDADLLSEWLTVQKGSKVTINVPSRGEKRALLSLVRQDVEVMVRTLDERAARRQEKQTAVREGFTEIMGEHIGASVRRIEAFDISNINGVDSVGGMVVFLDGQPYRKGYRRFKIRTVEGADDVGSLQEVLFRRLKKAGEDVPGFDQLPDLILMDGGKTQVNGARRVLEAMEIEIPVAGMIKDDRHRTGSLLYEGREIPLRHRQELFAFIGSIQEEVHRFAIDYHRKLRGKKMNRSALDEIAGVGEKRKSALFAHFGSMDAIKAASVEALAQVPGMNRTVADAVFRHFSAKDASPPLPEPDAAK
ncbi:MAG: excinuclease ABC subunit UvrC [Bacillota bacterium]|jgi:excinuclease ABC subunit C|nr:excinuclease ABC subunit UvrC [Eubacteriales bacterium]MDI9491362.1 excinuclease ABC subunit UvrC [Bacillota bacterium]NLV70723.1 excinuclease ABC subunit UvrC [Clostridiales bacterium]